MMFPYMHVNTLSWERRAIALARTATRLGAIQKLRTLLRGRKNLKKRTGGGLLKERMYGHAILTILHKNQW